MRKLTDNQITVIALASIAIVLVLAMSCGLVDYRGTYDSTTEQAQQH